MYSSSRCVQPGNSTLRPNPSFLSREESVNQRAVQREVRKMSPSQKEALGRQLLEEAAREAPEAPPTHPYQDSDFVNPFNTAPPATALEVSEEAQSCNFCEYAFSLISIVKVPLPKRKYCFSQLILLISFKTLAITGTQSRSLTWLSMTTKSHPVPLVHYRPARDPV